MIGWNFHKRLISSSQISSENSISLLGCQYPRYSILKEFSEPGENEFQAKDPKLDRSHCQRNKVIVHWPDFHRHTFSEILVESSCNFLLTTCNFSSNFCKVFPFDKMENNVEKMLDGVGHVGVKVKTRHHKLPREAVGHDFRKERGARNPQTPHLHLVASCRLAS